MNKFILFFFSFFSISCGKTQIIPVYNGTLGQKYSIKDSLVIDGYFDTFSNTQGDSGVLYLNSKNKSNFVQLSINDVNGGLVDYIQCDSIIPQKPVGDSISKNGFNYQYKIKFKINESIRSGVYLISNKIPFLIKNRIKRSDVLVVYPSNTVEAYNNAGGFDLYSINQVTNQFYGIVSFKRPKKIDNFSISFLKQYIDSNYNYISDFELDDYQNFKNYNLVVFIGHNEYWTRAAKLNFDHFINNRGNALILSGNTCWWQARYSSNKDKLVCYKDYKNDPINDDLYKTINWTDATLKSSIISSIGADFDKGGYGLGVDNGWDGFKILLPNSPILFGTNLKYNDIISLPTHEYDGTFTNLINGVPIIDNNKLKFFKSQLIGYDFGFRSINTIGTFFVFQKENSSGYIINTASTNWCAKEGLGGKDGAVIKKITDNCIYLLRNNLSPF